MEKQQRGDVGSGRRWGRIAAIVVATAALVAPVTAFASHQFTDVPNSNIFHDDIDWMRDNGVTAGCNPPANDEYCPEENVTREQMAAFMRRLESKGVFLPKDGKAADADRLDGQNGSYYANPIAIASGSELDGTDITSDGEVTRLTLQAPAAGDVVARVTGTWGDNTSDYTALLWIEPHQPGSECDNFLDGQPLAGTVSAFSSHGGELTGVSAGSSAGAGSDAGVSAGTYEYSLCAATTVGTHDNFSWSGSVEWRASGASTAAMTTDSSDSSMSDAGDAFSGG